MCVQAGMTIAQVEERFDQHDVDDDWMYYVETRLSRDDADYAIWRATNEFDYFMEKAGLTYEEREDVFYGEEGDLGLSQGEIAATSVSCKRWVRMEI